MNDYILVIIDGCNNSGKGTVISELEKRLLANGMTYKKYHQPYFSENRKVLLSGKLDYIEEYEIFKYDRTKLYEKIEKECSNTDIVIMDRSIVSSLCYQALLQNNYKMFWNIIRDSSELYNDKKVAIGVNLYASPNVVAIRKDNSDDSEYDYRDTDNIDKIEIEINAFKTAWNTFLSLGIVNHYFEFRNDSIYDIKEIVNKLDEKILKLYKKKD